MGFISAILGIDGADGNRVDSPQLDGSFLPMRIKLGNGLTVVVTQNGSVSIATLSVAPTDLDTLTAVPMTIGAAHADSVTIGRENHNVAIACSGGEVDITGGVVNITAQTGMNVNTPAMTNTLGSPAATTINSTTSTPLLTVTLPSGQMVYVSVIVLAIVISGADTGKVWTTKADSVYKNLGGTITQVGSSAVILSADQTTGGIVGVVTPTITSSSITTNVKGIAGEVVQWYTRVDLTYAPTT